MSNSINNVVISGNLGKDCELRYTPQGVAVCNFTVAVNEVWGKKDDRKEKVVWIRVTVWRERAETLANYLKKGTRVSVIGKITGANAYLGKDGKPQATVEIEATNVNLEPMGNSNGATGSTGSSNGNSRANELPTEAVEGDEEVTFDAPFDF